MLFSFIFNCRSSKVGGKIFKKIWYKVSRKIDIFTLINVISGFLPSGHAVAARGAGGNDAFPMFRTGSGKSVTVRQSSVRKAAAVLGEDAEEGELRLNFSQSFAIKFSFTGLLLAQMNDFDASNSVNYKLLKRKKKESFLF